MPFFFIQVTGTVIFSVCLIIGTTDLKHVLLWFTFTSSIACIIKSVQQLNDKNQSRWLMAYVALAINTATTLTLLLLILLFSFLL